MPRPDVLITATSVVPAGGTLRRLCGTLQTWLRGRAPGAPAPTPAAAGALPEDSLALLRPLFAALIERPESPAPFAAP